MGRPSFRFVRTQDLAVAINMLSLKKKVAVPVGAHLAQVRDKAMLLSIPVAVTPA